MQAPLYSPATTARLSDVTFGCKRIKFSSKEDVVAGLLIATHNSCTHVSGTWAVAPTVVQVEEPGPAVEEATVAR